MIQIPLGEYQILTRIAQHLLHVADLRMKLANPRIILPGMTGQTDTVEKQQEISGHTDRAVNYSLQWGQVKGIVKLDTQQPGESTIGEG